MTSREVAEKTLEKLKATLGTHPSCPFCANRNWTISDKISITGTIDVETNSVNPASGVPGVTLVCNNCGYTASINPKAIGVMD